MSCRPISRALALLSLIPTLALALPTSPDVQAGGAFLDRVDKATMHITCQDKTVINWDTFSIDHHEALKFIQSADSTVLNRVTGHITGGDISRIMGTLESQGHVYILNPQGIFIGKDATINVGSLIASTLNITNADFFEACNGVKGKRGQEGLKEASVLFSGDSQAKVLNLGTIKATSGDVHVIAYEIDNQGTIEAAKGQVSLNACQEAILQPASNRRVLIKAKVKDADANLSETGVKNTGVIKALEARLGAEGSLYKLAINQSGHIEAKTFVEDKGGKIFLTAEKGAIKVDGKMVAGIVTPQSVEARPNKSEKGGYIEVMGETIRLEDKANIDVSGRIGGGVALIGSDYQGKGMPFNSQHTYIGKGANVTASAWGNGNGGKIIFWGDESIEFLGNVTAKGGPNGGDGGFVEVSSPGKQPGAFKVGGFVSTLAPKGKVGTLLWDPDDIRVVAGSSNNVTYSSDTYTQTSSDPTIGYIGSSELVGHLNTNSVIIDAGSGGQIIFQGSVSWSGGTQLTLKTGGGYISFETSVTGTGAGSSISMEAATIEVGKADYSHTNVVEVSADSIDVELELDNSSLSVYSGDGVGVYGLLKAKAGTLTVTESENVTGGQVFITSDLKSGGTDTGTALIEAVTGIDIAMNGTGSSDNVGEINIQSLHTQEAGIRNTGDGDVRLYCRHGEVILNASGGTNSKAFVEAVDGKVSYWNAEGDIDSYPMKGLDIQATNGSQAFIKATGLIDFGLMPEVFYDAVSLIAQGAGSSASIESTGERIFLDVNNSEVGGGSKNIILNASSGGEAKVDTGDKCYLYGDLDIDAGGENSKAYITAKEECYVDGIATIDSTDQGKAYIESGQDNPTAQEPLTITNIAYLSADGSSSEAYIKGKFLRPISLENGVDMLADDGGYVYVGDDFIVAPASGEGCGKVTINENESIESRLHAKENGADSHVYIYSQENEIEFVAKGSSGAGVALLNEGVGSSHVLIQSDSTESTAVEINLDGSLTLSVAERVGATSPAAYISGKGGATINPLGQVIMSATGEHTKAYITSTQGPVKLGTDTSRIGTLDMDATEKGIVYVGDAPDAVSAGVTDLEIYSTGNVTLGSSLMTAGKVWIHQETDLANPAIINISNGDLSLDGWGQFTLEPSSVAIQAGSGLNLTASGSVSLSATGSSALAINTAGSLGLSAASLTLSDDSGESSSTAIIADGYAINATDSVTVSGSSSYITGSSLVSRIAASGSDSDISITGGASSYIASDVTLMITAGRDVLVEDGASIQGSLNSGDTVITAGREVKVKGTSYIDSQVGDLFIITDNNYPSPSGNPNAGIGNLTLEAGASLRTTGNAGEIRIYAGFDENNRADIADTALINGSAYSTMKGALDTQDAHNYFGVWYDVSEPGYAAPATFYYKEKTPSTTEGVTNTADVISAGLISSNTLSSYFGDTLLNFLRRNYVHNTKNFKNQYRRAKTPLRRKVMGNKTPSSGDVGPQQSSPESSSGSFKTNTYRSKK